MSYNSEHCGLLDMVLYTVSCAQHASSHLSSAPLPVHLIQKLVLAHRSYQALARLMDKLTPIPLSATLQSVRHLTQPLQFQWLATAVVGSLYTHAQSTYYITCLGAIAYSYAIDMCIHHCLNSSKHCRVCVLTLGVL